MSRQVTIVSFYGPKPDALTKLIVRLQEVIDNEVGSAFERYDKDQVHATIIGLERMEGSEDTNLNFHKYRDRIESMGFGGLLEYLRRGIFPFQVQIGGFLENKDYGFLSQGLPPYKRSFSIQGDKAVSMGWPIPSRDPYPKKLDELRKGAQDFGILHGYHRAESDVDNDLYFRLGLFTRALTQEEKTSLENQVREMLGQREPLIQEVTLENTFVASYIDNTLPTENTKAWALSDPIVTREFIVGLYQ